MQPGTWEQWLNVAIERAQDADSIAKERSDSIGAVYMAGYAVECALKAYLKSKNCSFPTSGSKGHDLRNLWNRAGFRLSDIQDRNGNKTFFLEEWSTDLRYEVRDSDEYIIIKARGVTIEELIEGARQLSGWIYNQIRRRGRRT